MIVFITGCNANNITKMQCSNKSIYSNAFVTIKHVIIMLKLCPIFSLSKKDRQKKKTELINEYPYY